MPRLISALLFSFFIASASAAQEAEPEPRMDLARLGEIVLALDPEAQTDGRQFRLTIEDIPVLIVTDPLADRMRAMVPIRRTDGMSEEDLMRVMQANFDTALDARYAVAHGQLWGTFIHPLSPLEKRQLISALGQTVNLAKTYGTLFTGGAMSFGGGDSTELHRELLERLQKKGEEI